MLKRIIRSIRRKPKAVRDQIAFWIAISFTSLVILVWVVTIPGRYGGEASEIAVESHIEDDRSFSDVLGEVRDELESFTDDEPDTLVATPASTTPPRPATTTASNTPALVNDVVAPIARIATFTAPVATTTP